MSVISSVIALISDSTEICFGKDHILLKLVLPFPKEISSFNYSTAEPLQNVLHLNIALIFLTQTNVLQSLLDF